MKHLTILLPLLPLLIACGGKDPSGTVQPETLKSKYYVLDISPKKARPGFTFIPLPAFQQTTEYTCGPASVLTLLNYYGIKGDEMTIAREMGTSTTCGTNPQQMYTWLRDNGFRVDSGQGGSLEMIRANLDKKTPVLIEWSDWGGHWVVAIGYDTRNTADPMDDVIIFADPYDRHDDNEDGLTWFNAGRFYYMWYDALLFERVMKQLDT